MSEPGSAVSSTASEDVGEVADPPQVRLPEVHGDHDQDQEWCEVELENGSHRRIRFHDYDDIYSVPGLYEEIFYEELECSSPETVSGLLAERLEAEDVDLADLRVFDVGAGNGMVGEALAKRGATSLVGVDIIEEAAMAAARDRPGLYDDYLVLDLTDIPDELRESLSRRRLNCLTTVAALGFDDMPPRAFTEAYNLILDEGWIAFNIKEDFLHRTDGTGFARLARRMVEAGTLELLADRRYRHRLSVAGEPLYYVAIVARKRNDVPDAMLEGLEA